MAKTRVLVTCATGKVGLQVVKALQEAGFEVYATTRSASGSGATMLKNLGATPLVCDYTKRADLDQAFKTSDAKMCFFLTDFFLAAKGKVALEIEQGKMQVDACKAANCVFTIYSSACDGELMGPKVKHLIGKPVVEKYLLASGIKGAIVRPTAFFENYDDPINYNPLKKGKVAFLSEVPVKMCATYDIGRAAAKMFANPDKWNGKALDIASWMGSGADVAAALQKISGTPTKFSLAMPKFFRRLFLNDLHHMCNYFEKRGGFTADIAAFKEVVPDALSIEDWLRLKGCYSNGEKFC